MKPHPSLAIRAWGVLCHLSALTYLIPLLTISNSYLDYMGNRVRANFPFSLVICLVTVMLFLWFMPQYGIWISQRKIHPFIDRQGREVNRFQLWMAKYVLFPWLFFIFGLYTPTMFWLIPNIARGFASSSATIALSSLVLGMFIGLSYLTIGAVSLIMVLYHLFQIILAADKASHGELYFYPVGKSH